MKKVFRGLLLGVIAIAMVLSLFACANEVEVTFKDGDTVVATVKVEQGKALSAEDFPEAPVKEGYEFLGWYAEDTKLTAETLISGAITFGAKYEKKVENATLTFKNGDDTVSTKTAAVGTALTAADIPAAPTLADHTFLGWYVGETKVEAGYTLTADATATAKFAHDTAKVTFKSGDTVLGEKTLDTKSALTAEDFPADPTLTDYTFVGWYVGDEKIGAGYVVTADVTVTAKFAHDTVKITFKVGDTEYATATVEKNTALAAADFPATAPTLADHHFIGWYVGETKVEAGHVVSADTTLTAKFAHDTAKVIFKSGDTVLGEKTLDTKSALTAADFPADPTLADHHFIGWYVGETQVEAGYIVTADVTVTAKFAHDTAKVIFKNGDTVLDEKTLDTKTALTAEDFPADPTLTDYTFVGWYVGDEKIGAGYVVTANVTVTAKFARNTAKITFMDGDNKLSETTKETHDKLADIDFPGTDPAAKKGYHFAGWYVGDTKIEAGYVLDADVVAVAKYEKNTYKVAFVVDGETVKEIDVLYDELPDLNLLPGDPTKEGYTFDNWYAGEVVFDEDATVTDNITYTAEFTKTSWFVTFRADGVKDQIVYVSMEDGKLTEVPKNLANTATAHFLGWYKGTTKAKTGITITEDTVFEAKFVTVNDFTGVWYNIDETFLFQIDGTTVKAFGASYTATFDVKNGELIIDLSADKIEKYWFSVDEDGKSIKVVHYYWDDGEEDFVTPAFPLTAFSENGVTGTYLDGKSEIITVENGIIKKYGSNSSDTIYFGMILAEGDGYHIYYRGSKQSNMAEYTVKVDGKGNWLVTEVGKTVEKIYVAGAKSAEFLYCSATQENIYIYTLEDESIISVYKKGDTYAYTEYAVKDADRSLSTFTVNGETKTVKVSGTNFSYPGKEAGTYTNETYGDAVVDGFGYVTVGGVEYRYDLNKDNNVAKIYDKETGDLVLVLTIDTEAYTYTEKEKDAFAGEYEYYVDYVKKDGVVITLDGYGTVTYVFNNGSPKYSSYVIENGKLIFTNVDYSVNGVALTPSTDNTILNGVKLNYKSKIDKIVALRRADAQATLNEDLFGWYTDSTGKVVFNLYRNAGLIILEGYRGETFVATAFFDGTAVCFTVIDTCTDFKKEENTFFLYMVDGEVGILHPCKRDDGDGGTEVVTQKESYTKLAEAPAAEFPEAVRGKTWYTEDNNTVVLDENTVTCDGTEATDLKYFGSYYTFLVGDVKYVLKVDADSAKVYLGTTKENVTILSETRNPNKYTVTFVDEDGKTIGTAKVVEGDNLKASDFPADLTKTDAVFLGWYNGTDKAVAGETAINGNVTFTAKFLAKADYIGTWVDLDNKVMLNISSLLFKGAFYAQVKKATFNADGTYSYSTYTLTLSADGKSLTLSKQLFDMDGAPDGTETYTLTKVEEELFSEKVTWMAIQSKKLVIETNGFISEADSSKSTSAGWFGLVTKTADGYKVEYRTSATAKLVTLLITEDERGNWVTSDGVIYVKNASKPTEYSNNSTGKYENLYVFSMPDGTNTVLYKSTDGVITYAEVEGTIAVGNIITFTAGDKTATVKLVKVSYSNSFVYPAAEKGEYTGEGETLTLDGFDGATYGEKIYTYIINGTLVVLSADGEESLAFNLDAATHTYTVAQKIGFEGTYDLWKNLEEVGYTLTLDGYGNATLKKSSSSTVVGTYTVSEDGTTITLTLKGEYVYSCAWTLANEGNVLSLKYNEDEYELINQAYEAEAPDLSAYVNKYYTDGTDVFYFSIPEITYWGDYEFAFWLDSGRDFYATWNNVHVLMEGTDFEADLTGSRTDKRFFLVTFADGKITLRHYCKTGFDDDGEVVQTWKTVVYTECERPAVTLPDEVQGTFYTPEGSLVVIEKDKVTLNGVASTAIDILDTMYGIYSVTINDVAYTLTYDSYGDGVWFGATALFEGELPTLLTAEPDESSNPFLGTWKNDNLTVVFGKAGALTYGTYALTYAILNDTAYFLAPDGETLVKATVSGTTLTIVATMNETTVTDTLTKEGASEPDTPAEENPFVGTWKRAKFDQLIVIKDDNTLTLDGTKCDYELKDGELSFTCGDTEFVCTVSGNTMSIVFIWEYEEFSDTATKQ